jgi:SAM-dependent methyltransferase
LDVAAGPVAGVNQRLRQAGLPGEAVQGSILAAPFDDASFDHVVAIGCLHHTGDLQRAIDECHRLLRPGGSLVFMVYYAYSYRRFMQARGETIRYWLRERFGHRGVVGTSVAVERAAYDSNKQGDAAPHTDWISAKSLRYMCRHFSSFRAHTENIVQEPPFQDRTRNELLLTRWPHLCGLDLYAVATK